MTHSKSRREGEDRARKENQQPHGKVKSFQELTDGVKNQTPDAQPADYDEIEY
ncbi:DUF6254 family protein [Fictibacillus aquaticus]|uniref:DUF6254 family protein n=1 Tax=Fictibacillus aquaticus TaxID=2021314 RepID=UPI0013FE4236|nr:DUF6254 family protein [Fictibacillus aquaticus]